MCDTVLILVALYLYVTLHLCRGSGHGTHACDTSLILVTLYSCQGDCIVRTVQGRMKRKRVAKRRRLGRTRFNDQLTVDRR